MKKLIQLDILETVRLVRWDTNLAQKAIELGANVTLIIGPTNLTMDLENIQYYKG